MGYSEALTLNVNEANTYNIKILTGCIQNHILADIVDHLGTFFTQRFMKTLDLLLSHSVFIYTKEVCIFGCSYFFNSIVTKCKRIVCYRSKKSLTNLYYVK